MKNKELQARRNGEDGMHLKRAGWQMGLLAAAWVCIAAQGFAETETVDGVEWSYSVSNGAAIVTAANPARGDLRIPSTLGGMSVTDIGRQAFYSCTNVLTVTIPDGVTTIGASAFDTCHRLSSVTIPASVTDIGTCAFYRCNNLQSLPIPDGVTEIGPWAFYACSSLTTMTIPDGVSELKTGVFYGCYNLTSVAIPNSVTNIRDRAFINCRGLTSLTIPGRVAEIGDMAFWDCQGLGSVAIPDSVTKIGDEAFIYCMGLTNLTIGRSVANIGDLAFAGCRGLRSLTIPGSVEEIGEAAFSGCSGLSSVTIPGNVTSIGAGIFRHCSGLTKIEVEKENAHYTSERGVLFSKDMGVLLQFPCGRGERYEIPDSVTSLEAYAFSGCGGLVSLAIPGSVTNVGLQAFSECNGLTTLALPGSVTCIGDSVFDGCDGLTELYVPALWEGTTMLESAAVPSGCKIVYGEPSLVIRLTGLPGNPVDVGEEVLVRAEAEYASGDVEYKWEGDAPGSGEGGVFWIDTGAAGGPYTLMCTAVDEAGETAEAEVTFRIAVRYSIAIAADIENGSVRVDRERAEEGETVVLTAVPESGYRFVEFLVNGRAIAGNTFTMPGRDVVVSATFEEKLDYARLPFVGEDTPYSGPWGNESVDGMTAKGIGNYSDGSAKFDGTGDYLQIKFVGRPDALSYGIRGNGTDGLRPSTFLVQESADGIEWRVLARHVSGENLFSGKRTDMSCELSSDTRQVRFYYENRNAGNVGIYDVYIGAGEGELSVEFDREEGFEVETGSDAEITATARNGRKPYAFRWAIDGEEAEGGEGGTFTIPGTLEEGPHRVAATATDADGDTARGEVGFTVTGLAPRYAVSIAVDVGHGMVWADKAEAKEGETVTLSAEAEDGYRFAAFLVDGEEIAGNSFAMPAAAVVVSARFEKKSGEVFEKIWGLDEIGEGEYVLAGSDAKGTHAAVARLVGAVTVLAVEDVEPEGDAIDSPKASLVWTVARRGEGWTIHNDAVGYLGYEGDINSATAEETASEASTWTFSEVAGGIFKVSNVGTPGRTLRYNPQSPRFACYTSDTMTNIELFKRRGSGGGEGVSIGGLAVSGGMLSFDAPEGAFTVEGSTNLLDKGAWRIVEGAEVEEGRVVVSLEGEYGVFRVVW